MKGHILFALLFAALMALGISSLNDLQAQKAALPPQRNVAAYIAALPPADKAEELSAAEESALPALQIMIPAPRMDHACIQAAPPLSQSYHLAHYQAFHYSDCAG